MLEGKKLTNLTTVKQELKGKNHTGEKKMIIPIRCNSCGKPIGHLWEQFKERTQVKGEEKKKVLDELELERFCCRAMFLGHKDLIDVANRFKKW